MLLNGYLLNRAIIQQKYKQKQTSFQTLVPINKMHELSIRLLEPTINTFDKDNIKEIKVNQKKLNELEKDKEDKEDKEDKGKDEEKGKEKDKDVEKDYELLDVEDIHIQPKDVKKITIDIPEEDIQKMEPDDIPDLKKDADADDEDDIPDLKKESDDSEDDIPDLKEDSEDEISKDEISKDVKQIGGELGPAIKNVVVSFF